tara:strand:+ start:1216 stop:1377 length:162 start_codon:yes stop_codon:yes gene_type:complete
MNNHLYLIFSFGFLILILPNVNLFDLLILLFPELLGISSWIVVVVVNPIIKKG